MHVIVLQYAWTVADKFILKTTCNYLYRADSKIYFL